MSLRIISDCAKIWSKHVDFLRPRAWSDEPAKFRPIVDSIERLGSTSRIMSRMDTRQATEVVVAVDVLNRTCWSLNFQYPSASLNPSQRTASRSWLGPAMRSVATGGQSPGCRLDGLRPLRLNQRTAALPQWPPNFVGRQALQQLCNNPTAPCSPRATSPGTSRRGTYSVRLPEQKRTWTRR